MNFYFTFGQIHKHSDTGEEMKDYYIKIRADNARNARQIMFDNFGNKWAFMYEPENFHPEYYPKGCYKILQQEQSDKKLYAVYGNDKITPLQITRIRMINQKNCIYCPDGKQQAEDCKKINPELEIIGPTKKDILKLQGKILK